MSRKPTLSDALQEVSPRLRPSPTSSAVTPVANAAASKTPGRQGKCQIAGFFDPAASKQLKLLALDADSTVQGLLREALNDLFKKHGLPPIA
jgi:hypothetical protein